MTKKSSRTRKPPAGLDRDNGDDSLLSNIEPLRLPEEPLVLPCEPLRLPEEPFEFPKPE